MKPPCTQSCRLKCKDKLSETNRLQVFNSFWKLSSVDIKRAFILSMLQERAPKRTISASGSSNGRKRQKSITYSLEIAKIRHQVCKTFFINTLCISEQVVKTALLKRNLCGGVDADKRGKCTAVKTKDIEARKLINDHIEKLPLLPSHYCRKDSSKVYLPSNYNIALCYKLFLESLNEQQKYPCPSFSTYSRVFNSKNISIHNPKKDSCNFCEKWKNSSEVEKRALQAQFNQHQANKAEIRNIKEQAKVLSNSECLYFGAFAFDLQAALPSPKGEISSFYYARKLSAYNFSIFDLNNKDVACYFWHEGIAARGANEISTCLFRYVCQQDKDGKKKLACFSDNCFGQNKNVYVCSMFLYCVCFLENIDEIDHIFLEAGHTQNENDCVHSLIERSSRNVNCYTPDQWAVLIRSARPQQPFNLVELDVSDILDWHKIASEIIRNREIDSNGNHVDFQKIRWFNYKKYTTGTDNEGPFISFKYQVDKPFSKFFVKRYADRFLQKPVLQPSRAAAPKISAAKKNDLVKLCSSLAIPKPYHAFYDRLSSADTVVDTIENC